MIVRVRIKSCEAYDVLVEADDVDDAYSLLNKRMNDTDFTSVISKYKSVASYWEIGDGDYIQESDIDEFDVDMREGKGE